MCDFNCFDCPTDFWINFEYYNNLKFQDPYNNIINAQFGTFYLAKIFSQ